MMFKAFLEPFAKRGWARKVVLIHCPTFNFESLQLEVLRNRGYYAYPPRALQCLQTVAKAMGVEADILDLNFLMLEALMSAEDETADPYALLIGLVDRYAQAQPDVRIFGVSTGVIVPNIFLVERHPFLEILRHLMSKDGIVISGGPCATLEARNLVKGGWVHAAFKGEAEDRLRYFLSLLFGDTPTATMSGIGFMREGRYEESEGSCAMVEPKSVLATYKHLPVEQYHEVGCLSPFSRMVGTDVPYASIQLNRGCRMKCTFCGLSQYRGSNEVKQLHAGALFEEIEFLATQRGVRHFEWLDEDLLANREDFIEVLSRVAAADFRITWAADIGIIASSLDEPLLELMERSGCVGFRIGVESGNEEMLRKIKKPATKRNLRGVSELLRRHPKIFVCGLYMLGFDDERYGQMFDTMNFAMELGLSWAHFNVYQRMGETDVKTAKSTQYKDFLPSTQKVVGSSAIASEKRALSAREVFALPRQEVHAAEALQEMWFAFNLVANYLCNRNLREGRVELFLRWLGGLQLTYPRHPVMSLFLALGYLVAGERSKADAQFGRTRRNLGESAYWRSRFEGYGLNRIMEAYPTDRVPQLLAEVVSGYGLRA